MIIDFYAATSHTSRMHFGLRTHHINKSSVLVFFFCYIKARQADLGIRPAPGLLVALCLRKESVPQCGFAKD